MRLVCAPENIDLPTEEGDLRVVLFGQAGAEDRGSAGDAVKNEFLRRRLEAAPRAWDLLSIALSVVTADYAGIREQSPDGWTREFELEISVSDPVFWNAHADDLAKAVKFLTTDRWFFRFHGGGILPAPPKPATRPDADCVVLLSGGLDSLVGAIDLASSGRRPLAVSQTVRGDAVKQVDFAARIAGGLSHLQLNHNAHAPGVEDTSQRARSLIFIAFGVMSATSLGIYHDGGSIDLFLCENGFIAINPPLTGARLGSLSTRTAHPHYLGSLQRLLHHGGLRVRIRNPYATATKGEMLQSCADQTFLRSEAARSTSCGRFQRFNYRHCGRCIPCHVRRAAFAAWGVPDTTQYVYTDLGRDDAEHAGFDDVRSVAMAVGKAAGNGLNDWLGPALSSPLITNRADLEAMISRGLAELQALHKALGVK
ncbi:7-cyano-7-deazaguanine synthase in queuosine biosynthesis [Bradyrhizobium sp. F1.2.2]